MKPKIQVPDFAEQAEIILGSPKYSQDRRTEYWVPDNLEKRIEMALRAAYRQGWKDCDDDFVIRGMGISDKPKARKK